MELFTKIYSADFQCPDTGVPVALIYDEEKCRITADICYFVWDSWVDEGLYEKGVYEEAENKTNKWCKGIHYNVDDFNDANMIAERYGTWFN